MIRVHIRKKDSGTPYWQMFYRDPVSGRQGQRSTKERKKRDAIRVAVEWERQLNAGAAGTDISWEIFRDRFEIEYCASRSTNTQAVYKSALNAWESVIGQPPRMSLVTPMKISEFQAGLRRSGKSEQTIKTYLKHLRAALRWAERIGLIDQAPRVELPRTYTRGARGRAITEDEFRTVLAAIPQVAGIDHDSARWFLRGLWYSGFRLGELMALSDQPPVQLDLDGGRFARVIWHPDGHKSRKRQTITISPDFAAMLRERPIEPGPIFVFRSTHGPITNKDNVGRFVADIGRASGIRVSETKFVTAHDFRRSAATRWAKTVRPMTLKMLMRHADIKTTLEYYVDQDADEVGAELYR